MIPVPSNSPLWFAQTAKAIDAADAEVPVVYKIKVFPLATLPAAADYWRTKVGFQETGGIAVQATAGVTWCLSDGTNWIDMQTGSAVA